MRKFKKILMIMIMMLTMTLTLASCNNSNTGDSGDKNNVDLTTLTSADVFKNIEAGSKKITYAQLSGSSAVNSNSDNMVKIKAFASYKFEVSKIVAKFQSSYDNHTTNITSYNGYDVEVYNTASFDEKNIIKASKNDFKNSSDYNKQHTVEITFTSGELVVEKNKGIGLWLAGGKYGYTIWSNIEIQGRVIA